MKYEMDARVRFSEIDEYDHMTISALINYMQDCCTFQSEDCGYELEKLRSKHMGWFLLSWKIELHALPKMGDRIKVQTWVSNYNGLFANRWFEIVDAKGSVMARVLSIWTLMDVAKLRVMRIPEEMKTAYCFDDPIPGNFGGRKMKSPERGELRGEFTVETIHLDTNHHMNNARYIEVAKEMLPDGFEIHFLEVEYRKQAVLGDRVKIEVIESETNMNFPDGVISDGSAYSRSVTVLLKNDEDEIYAVIDFLE